MTTNRSPLFLSLLALGSLLSAACGARALPEQPDLVMVPDLVPPPTCTRGAGVNGICCVTVGGEFHCLAPDTGPPLVCDPKAPRCVPCGTAGVPCCPSADGPAYCRDGGTCVEGLCS